MYLHLDTFGSFIIIVLDFTSRVITGACKKISDHELKDCSFFFIVNIGVFY